MSGKAGAANKKKEDGAFDLEQQFVLRMPLTQAKALKQDVQAGAQSLKDKLLIELQPESRIGKVIYGGQILNAKLVDLPCIVESLKSTDAKTFYKTADISQMLVCVTDDEEPEELDNTKKKKDKDKKYQWNHGICQPLKNVRKRRFRKTLQKKNQELPNIEKEVRQLFAQDSQAVNVKWEVVYEKNQDVETVEKQGTTDNTLEGDEATNEINEKFAFGEIFGDVSSSDDDDDGEREVNVMDSGDENASTSMMRVDTRDSMMDFQMAEPRSSEPDISTDLQNKLHEVKQQLNDLQEKRIAKESLMSIVDTSSDRDLLQAELQSITEEESTKEKEFAILNSMLSNT